MTICKCPHCGGEINPASLLAKVSTESKAAAARENGKKGGRPKKVTAQVAHGQSPEDHHRAILERFPSSGKCICDPVYGLWCAYHAEKDGQATPSPT